MGLLDQFVLSNVAQKIGIKPNSPPPAPAPQLATNQPKSGPMVFPVGQNLTPTQTYNANQVFKTRSGVNPDIFHQIANAPRDIAQGFSRAVGETGLSVLQAFLPKSTKEQTLTVQPKTGIERAVFGDEPLKPLATQVATQEQQGNKLAFPLVVGSTVANLFPFGGGAEEKGAQAVIDHMAAQEAKGLTEKEIISSAEKKFGKDVVDNVIGSARDSVANDLNKTIPILQNGVNKGTNTLDEFTRATQIAAKIEKGNDTLGDLAKARQLVQDSNVSENYAQGFTTKPIGNNPQAGFINPGAMAEDIKNSPVGQATGEIRSGLSPQTASPEAQRTADLVAEAKAKIDNAKALESYQYKDASKYFSKLDSEANIKNISSYEKTGAFENAPKGYSDFYKNSIDNSRQILQQTYGNDRVGYVENYVRRQFEFGSAADEAKGTAYLTNKVGSLSANTSPLKSRVLNMPLDEALADMKARGIKVKPVTTNPELLRQWSVANANQAATYAKTWQDLKDGNLIKFVGASDHVPEDMVKLDDRAAQVFFPSEAGMVKSGQYYADKNVARILNNTVSKGLGGSPTFQAVRALNNSINQLQLGLSAFHLTGTAINAGISDLSLGLRQLMNGEVGKGLTSLGRGAVPGYSFVRDTFNGRSIINGLTEGNPEMKKFLEEKLNPAGGRLKIDQEYTNQATKKMLEGFKSQSVGGFLKGAVKIPSAILEQVSKPLMEYAIPRVKLGAFADLADATLARLPADATDAMRQRALRSAWDSIDNRFGQLVYDNLFWNKTVKDLAMVSTRSVGWNLGTIRELGGGIKDVATQTAMGKGISDRTLYALALPIYAGIIGATYQYLHTGKLPSSLKDYFYPQNGLKDATGNKDRVSLPTYMKDVYAYSNDPIGTVEHKASPLLSMAADLATNRNYYGDMVRNPNDPAVKQLQQVGAYVLSNIQPFSVQQGVKTSQEGGKGQAIENFFGFTKAPGSIVKSQAQKDAAAAYIQSHGGFAPRTPEQQQAATDKQQLKLDAAQTLKQMLTSGDPKGAFNDLAKTNPDLAKQVASLYKDQQVGRTALDKTVRALGVADGTRAKFIADQINKLGSTQEKKDYYQHLIDTKVITPQVNDQVLKLLNNKPNK